MPSGSLPMKLSWIARCLRSWLEDDKNMGACGSCAFFLANLVFDALYNIDLPRTHQPESIDNFMTTSRPQTGFVMQLISWVKESNTGIKRKTSGEQGGRQARGKGKKLKTLQAADCRACVLNHQLLKCLRRSQNAA